MTITIDLLQVITIYGLYYIIGLTIVASFHLVGMANKTHTWKGIKRQFTDPIFYAALVIWPYFIVKETFEHFTKGN